MECGTSVPLWYTHQPHNSGTATNPFLNKIKLTVSNVPTTAVTCFIKE